MKLLALLIIALGFVGVWGAIGLRNLGAEIWSYLLFAGAGMALVGGAWLLERKPRPRDKSDLRYLRRRLRR